MSSTEQRKSERRPLIAVAGDARIPAGGTEDAVAEAVGRCLIEGGYGLLTGGLGGVMEAACRGARLSPLWTQGSIVGVLPGHDPGSANACVDVALATGLDVGRNIVVAHADALIAIGGGAGTLTEIAMAWQMHRLVLGLRGPGWSGRLADQRVDDRVRYPDVPDDRVYGFATAEEALQILSILLPQYRRAYRGVGGGLTPSASAEPRDC